MDDAIQHQGVSAQMQAQANPALAGYQKYTGRENMNVETRQPGLLDTVTQEAGNLNGQISTAADRLENIVDHLLGPVPQEVAKTSAPPSTGVGIHATSIAVDTGHKIMDRIHRALNRLETL